MTITLALLALGGCANWAPTRDTSAQTEPNESLGATYTSGPRCEWTHTVLEGSADTGLGVTVDEQLAAVQDTVKTTLKWDQTGETTALSSAFTVSEVDWVTGILADADSGASEDCPPYLAMVGSLSLFTEDGRLAENVPVEANSSTARTARIDASLDMRDLVGGDLPLGIDPTDWDRVTIDIAVNISQGVSGGELAVLAETSSSSSYQGDIARWPWKS